MNILVLTSIYPHVNGESSDGVTPVVHYFAKEWVKKGHNVQVINSCNRYPKLLYILPRRIIKFITSKFDVIVPKISQGKDLLSTKDGVKIARFPMLKILPKRRYYEIQVERQLKKIIAYLSQNDFKPDLIVGHWENPQIPLLSKLKKIYHCRTSLVFHGIVYINQKINKKWTEKYIHDIDVIGVRSNAIARKVKSLLKLDKDPFICCSGIPDEYFENINIELVTQGIKSGYLYVGRLIKRKNVDISIKALKEVYGNQNFTFNIIGIGDEKSNLECIIEKDNLNKNIKLLGYLPREEVIKLMDESEVFIMISDNETFGLVYLEAMSRGCIVIASKDSGVDGIIKDGYNGFLCEQGNKEELKKVLKKIRRLSAEDKKIISQNAIKTAFNFRDSCVAELYLENVLKEN